jgi:hypothetical protein
MTMSGKSVRLFLVDGSPTGLLTAEIMNWTGHILTAPRSRIAEALKRLETNRTGIYLLGGEDPSDPSKLRIYVGEGDRVSERIKSHDKDESKDFWTHLYVVTSKDANLTKAHVRYLESRIVELAKAAGRANVANGNEPGAKQLPESDVAVMELFLSQRQIALRLVGLDVIRPKPQNVMKNSLLVPNYCRNYKPQGFTLRSTLAKPMVSASRACSALTMAALRGKQYLVRSECGGSKRRYQ